MAKNRTSTLPTAFLVKLSNSISIFLFGAYIWQIEECSREISYPKFNGTRFSKPIDEISKEIFIKD